MHTPPAAPSIEAFAQLCAMLDDGFAARAAVLSSVGLDEKGWLSIRAEWVSRLAAGDPADLAQRFRRAYAHACQHPEAVSTPGNASLPRAAEPQNSDAVPQMGDDADRTAALAFPLAVPAVPFRVSPPWLSPSAVQSPPGAVSASRAQDPTEATLQVPCAPVPPESALPFGPAQGHRRRLERFDTQTGEPLSTPRWVDEPTPI